jgi:hypothetical protein
MIAEVDNKAAKPMKTEFSTRSAPDCYFFDIQPSRRTSVMKASMKFVVATLIGIGGLAASVEASSAMTLAPRTPASSPLVQDVRWGCGPGWHPSPWGRCVPNRRVYYGGPVRYYGGYGYGHRGYGWNRGYGWHRGYHRWGY